MRSLTASRSGRIKLGLITVAVTTIGLASTAYGATTYTTTATGSPKGGTKKAPAPFSGSWTLVGDAGAGVRPATPVSWSWSWEGVVSNAKGIPTCTAAQIDAAQSDSVCPPGSKIGVTGAPLVAQFGPIGDPLTSVDCNGKNFEFFNAGNNAMTLFIVGPADQCGGLDYLPPVAMTVTRTGNSSTFTIPWLENLTHPLPGLQSSLNSGGATFPVTKAATKSLSSMATSAKKTKKKPTYFLSDVGCKGPTRDFTYTVVDEETGTNTITGSSGKCKPPKKNKKNKK